MAESSELTERLIALSSVAERNAHTNIKVDKLFVACLKASFVKAFEFACICTTINIDHTFFVVPALRSITEDLIYLRFFSTLAEGDREKLVEHLIAMQVNDKLASQRDFFGAIRPFQRVLSPLDPTASERIIRDGRAVWKSQGFWEGLDRYGKPSARRIATRISPTFLSVMYDYMYNLTSSTVHFNPLSLLRSGWGPDVTHATFSTKNMSHYHFRNCQIYGGMLFCLYLELFDDYIQLDSDETSILMEYRRSLFLEPRWPEMVTFEEMNQPLPEPTHEFWLVPWVVRLGYADMVREEGFIKGIEKIQQMG